MSDENNNLMYGAIRDFYKQFLYRPSIKNKARFPRRKKFVVAGMGGSHLAADLLKVRNPALDIVIHTDYGLPSCTDLKERLIIVSSYSGNTEEALDAFRKAREMRLPAIAIATGGTLLARARRFGIPYIELPNWNIPPRSALGLSTMALLKAMSDGKGHREAASLAVSARLLRAREKEGRALARTIRGKMPVIYSSARNAPIAYTWKIKFNETGKMPSFTNEFPELNHNEVTGFLSAPTRARRFHFLFLNDKDDDEKIQRRMNMLAGMYRAAGLPVKAVPLRGASAFEKIFSSLILADWAAYYTAMEHGMDPEQVPFQEEFKRRMQTNRSAGSGADSGKE